MRYTASGLDPAPRKLYHDNLDLFSDSVPGTLQLDGQENRTLRRISREELRYHLRGESRKVLQDEFQAETRARKISREEPEGSAEALGSPACAKEPEVSVYFRKIPNSLSMDPSYSSFRLSIRERLDSPVEPYLGTRYMDDAEVNVSPVREEHYDPVSVDEQKVKVRDNKVLPKEPLYRKVLRSELGVSMNKGALFRHASTDGTFMNTAEEADASLEIQRAMSLRERRNNAASLKLSRDECNVTERPRLFQDIRLDNTLHTSADQTHREVDTVRPKISTDKSLVPDPGHFSQPDLTIDSLTHWTPDPLSHLVYDGILEKSYQSPLNLTSPGSLSHPASLHSMSTSSQSRRSSDGSGSSSTPSGSLTPADGNSGKKSSKLKNLFKKKKKKEKDQGAEGKRPQGGLQKL